MSCQDHPYVCVMCKQPTALVPGGLCQTCHDDIVNGGGGSEVVVAR